MTDSGRDGLSRQQKISWFLIGLILFSAVGGVFAETFTGGFNTYESPGKFNTSQGPVVVLGQDYQLEGGQPATASSINLSKQDGAWLNVSGEAGGSEVTVDHINKSAGGKNWTVITSASVSSANVTLQPSDRNFTTIGGGVTAINFTDVKVDDGDTDLVYSATSSGTIVVETDATDGTQYGLINQDTNEGIDVAVADSDGTVHFTDVDSGSDVEVRVEELGTLFIRNESEPHDLIDDATVEVMFFEDEDDNPTIEERTASNGQVDLTGLPVNEGFIVTITDADPYLDRQIILDDLSQQESIFLVNGSETTTVENRFQVNDRTGDFGPGETELFIEKAINRSEYGGSPSGISWTVIAADQLGGDQAVQFDLAEGDRYRLIVENADGDRRILGSYTARETGTIELDIGQIVADPTGPDQITAEGSWVNESGTVTVQFEYNDSSDDTNTLWVHIYERGNESNELLANTSFSGPLGAQSITETVPNDEEDVEWVVDFVAERDGENSEGQYIVGPQRTVLDQLPTWVKTLIALGTIIVVAGLFSQLNGDVGAVVVAGLGAMFWFVGFMPPEVSDGVIVLALITAGIIFIRERRGGGTGL